MAIEIWRNVTLSEITSAREILATAVLQGVSGISSRLAFLGDLGYLFELLLGAATAVFGAIGILRCFGWNPGNLGAGPIDERSNLSLDERRARDGDSWERDAEVTIRLEDKYLRRLHRHRCVVTIHSPLGTAESTGREAWYAKDEK